MSRAKWNKGSRDSPLTFLYAVATLTSPASGCTQGTHWLQLVATATALRLRDRQDAEKQKQSGLSVFPHEDGISILFGK